MKTLILIRHAHRDVQLRSQDNSLSNKGLKQVLALKTYCRKRHESPPSLQKTGGAIFLSSPKKRCIETLTPLADALGYPLQVESALNEKQMGEGIYEFEQRVERFLDQCTSLPAQEVYICSHGDWLPVASEKLLGISLQHKKASWLEVEHWSEQNQLKAYIPNFKHFF